MRGTRGRQMNGARRLEFPRTGRGRATAPAGCLCAGSSQHLRPARTVNMIGPGPGVVG